MTENTQVEYAEMLGRIFDRIGRDYNITFSRHSSLNAAKGQYYSGMWTYDDLHSSHLVTVYRWLGSSDYREAKIQGPIPIVSPEQEAQFENTLRESVKSLLASDESTD
jgi:hypothetical protein